MRDKLFRILRPLIEDGDSYYEMELRKMKDYNTMLYDQRKTKLR